MALNDGFEYREQIDNRGAGLTVLGYLSTRYGHSSEGEWRERIDGGEVFLDGRRAGTNARLKCGQWLLWRRPPWDEPDVPLTYSVLYEDAQLLAVAKPSGLPTVPAGGFLLHTLLALVRRVYPEAAPVHRLGRCTSGVVLFARTVQARSALCAAFRSRDMVKTYRALVCGAPPRDRFVVDTPIGPVPHPKTGTVHAASGNGKTALSSVTVLERRRDTSLVEVVIETGRPHQIRIHLAFAGYPLVGDPLYAAGGKILDPEALPGDSGYLLHAQRLRLRHPEKGEDLEIVCPAPPGLLRNEERKGQ